MKIQQENLPFKPITIKLEKKHEAEAFFSLIDKIEDHRCNEGSVIFMNDNETSLVIELSSHHSNGTFVL